MVYSTSEFEVQSMVIRMGSGKYTLPISSIKQSFKATNDDIITDPDGNEIINIKDKIYAVHRLNGYFADPTSANDIDDGILILMEDQRRFICMFVDALVEEKTLYVKHLPSYFEDSKYVLGCSVLNNSEISLALNVDAFFEGIPIVEEEQTEETVKKEIIVDDEKSGEATKDKYFVFDVCGEHYAIEIANVKEIIGICSITKVPDNPSYVAGLICLRGDVVPVISLRGRFSKPPQQYDALTCIVVVEYNDIFIGLIVDKVQEVVVIPDEDIDPTPKSTHNYHNTFIKAIGKSGDRVKLLIDLEKVLAKF